MTELTPVTPSDETAVITMIKDRTKTELEILQRHAETLGKVTYSSQEVGGMVTFIKDWIDRTENRIQRIKALGTKAMRYKMTVTSKVKIGGKKDFPYTDHQSQRLEEMVRIVIGYFLGDTNQKVSLIDRITVIALYPGMDSMVVPEEMYKKYFQQAIAEFERDFSGGN